MSLTQVLTQPFSAIIGLNPKHQAVCRNGQLFVGDEIVNDGTYRAELPGNTNEYQLTVIGGVPVLYPINHQVVSTYGTALNDRETVTIYM